MKTLTIATLSLLVLPAFTLVQKTPPQKASPEQGELEKKVAALEDELATLKEKSAQDKALLEQVVASLEGQSQEATKMLASLDESEQLGFTAGINFRSREVLLAGMRGYWSEVQKGVPKAPAKKADAQAPPARERSGS